MSDAWARLANAYRRGGVGSFAGATVQKLRAESGLAWLRVPPLRWWVRRALRPRSPAVLLLSLPRSGSSWVGATLGAAPDALYLREPVTQSYLARGGGKPPFELAGDTPPAEYAAAAENAFAGIPIFPGYGLLPLDSPAREIVHDPTQWHLSSRRHRRLVIKEVNPYACGYYLRAFSPRVVFLVRHPAAVLLSYQRLRWCGPTVDEWLMVAREHVATLSQALRHLQAYPDWRLVEYEALCSDPVERFRDLFAFGGLTWTEPVEQLLETRTTSGTDGMPYGLLRNSREVAWSWRTRVSPEHLAGLRQVFQEAGLPCYTAAEAW
jgi:hypothetical protein